MTNLPTVTTLDLRLDGGWLTVWFDQAQSRNALTAALQADLRAALAAVREDRAVRGITLRGRGGVFCAGGDLKAFGVNYNGAGARDQVIAMSKAGAQMFSEINSQPQVVIALIEGPAMAGGFGIACCADVVICAADARFAMTETTIGLSPAQISPFVIQKLGYATARRLMLTAARFDGREAGDLGVADFVGETVAELETFEAKIKAQVLACAPGAVADTKALILATPGLPREAVVQAAAENFADRLLSDEGREGVASFVEKRPPVWVDKG